MRKNVPVSKKVARVLITIVIILVTLVMIVPFVWMISASFKTEADVMKIPIEWIPKYFYPDNYKRVLSIGTTSSTNYHFGLAYFNSIKVAVISTVVAITSATLAGYAFAKLKFKGSNVLFIVYLAQMMVPSQLTLIPRFIMFMQLGWMNTHLSLIVPKIIAVSSTFMLRQSFLSTPDELREAARIDGATCQADDSGDGDSTVPGCMEQLPGSSGIYLQLEEMDDSSGFEPVCRYRGNTV